MYVPGPVPGHEHDYYAPDQQGGPFRTARTAPAGAGQPGPGQPGGPDTYDWDAYRTGGAADPHAVPADYGQYQQQYPADAQGGPYGYGPGGYPQPPYHSDPPGQPEPERRDGSDQQ